MKLDHDEIKNRFFLALGRLAYAHSQLDFNVGLALRNLGNDYGESQEALLEGTSPFSQRLRAFKSLMERGLGREPSTVLEINAWFDRAESLKAVRNDYVHARWGFPGELHSDDPTLSMLPMTWDWSAQGEKVRKVRLSELEKQSEEIDTFFVIFVPSW